ncbi:MAG: tRNA (guanosine(37)-N1)-methyltransferase TrmD, partial [Flavobacteriia bacterium]|nr:tRNA (guanosine(37)-N1)-methyltransferase TrmD [Flavobacteriia bacterium]
MRIDIITVLPELIRSPFEASILKRAQQKGLVEVHLHDLKAFGMGKHKQVDDYSFGGNAGMVLRPEPLFDCIEALQAERSYDAIIYTTPDGKRFDQKEANQLSLLGNIL